MFKCLEKVDMFYPAVSHYSGHHFGQQKVSQNIKWHTFVAYNNSIPCLHPKVTLSQKLYPHRNTSHNTIHILHLHNFRN